MDFYPHSDEDVDDLAHRLWDKSLQVDDCILWLGSASGKGYGVISWMGRQAYIHRLIYHFHNPNEILDVIRHTCDTPNCWHIDHLRNGTTADNVADKIAKARHIFGTQSYNSHLTEKDIIAIR